MRDEAIFPLFEEYAIRVDQKLPRMYAINKFNTSHPRRFVGLLAIGHKMPLFKVINEVLWDFQKVRTDVQRAGRNVLIERLQRSIYGIMQALRKNMSLARKNYNEWEMLTRKEKKEKEAKFFLELEDKAEELKKLLIRNKEYIYYLRRLLYLKVKENNEVEKEFDAIRTLFARLIKTRKKSPKGRVLVRGAGKRFKGIGAKKPAEETSEEDVEKLRNEIIGLADQAAHLMKKEERGERKAFRIERRILRNEEKVEKIEREMDVFIAKIEVFLKGVQQNREMFVTAGQQFTEMMHALHRLRNDILPVYRALLTMTKRIFERERTIEKEIRKVKQLAKIETTPDETMLKELSLIEESVKSQTGGGSVSQFFPDITGEMRAFRTAHWRMEEMLKILDNIILQADQIASVYGIKKRWFIPKFIQKFRTKRRRKAKFEETRMQLGGRIDAEAVEEMEKKLAA